MSHEAEVQYIYWTSYKKDEKAEEDECYEA